MRLWRAYIIAYLQEIDVKFKLNSVVWTPQNQVSWLLRGKYMENHMQRLNPLAYILLLEYSSPSHIGEILMSFLDND